MLRAVDRDRRVVDDEGRWAVDIRPTRVVGGQGDRVVREVSQRRAEPDRRVPTGGNRLRDGVVQGDVGRAAGGVGTVGYGEVAQQPPLFQRLEPEPAAPASAKRWARRR